MASRQWQVVQVKANAVNSKSSKARLHVSGKLSNTRLWQVVQVKLSKSRPVVQGQATCPRQVKCACQRVFCPNQGQLCKAKLLVNGYLSKSWQVVQGKVSAEIG